MIQSTKQILLFTLSIILTAFSAGSIMSFTDPQSAGLVTFIFLYLSIFLSLLGCFTLLGLLLRKYIFKKNTYIINLANSFRQALLISILIIVSLVLSSKGLLYWWVEGSLILFLLSLETFLNLKL